MYTTLHFRVHCLPHLPVIKVQSYDMPTFGITAHHPSSYASSARVIQLLVGVLRLQSLIGPLDDLWRRPDEKIADRLAADVFLGAGFSTEMIDRFFRPFLGGIFFDNRLRTTARELDFTFRMLALGENCLPEKGLGAVSEYMAGLLPKGTVRLNSAVKAVAEDGSSVTVGSPSMIRSNGSSV